MIFSRNQVEMILHAIKMQISYFKKKKDFEKVNQYKKVFDKVPKLEGKNYD